jgi:hypothetical protein
MRERDWDPYQWIYARDAWLLTNAAGKAHNPYQRDIDRLTLGHETDAGRGADAFEAATDDVQRVFGWVKQNAAGAAHCEATQAGDASGDRHGQIESEEGFTAFWLAANDADGFCGDQGRPGCPGWLGAGEVVGGDRAFELDRCAA